MGGAIILPKWAQKGFEALADKQAGKTTARRRPKTQQSAAQALDAPIDPRAARPKEPWLEPGMNKTEAEYAHVLRARQSAGQVLAFGYERLTFRLAFNLRYTPDYDLLMPDGTVQIHEIKGFWEEDARVKIKTAAQMFPHFRFVGVQKLPAKKGGGWSYEWF
jgi:hypothetical protein